MTDRELVVRVSEGASMSEEDALEACKEGIERGVKDYSQYLDMEIREMDDSPVVSRVDEAYRQGDIPIAIAEVVICEGNTMYENGVFREGADMVVRSALVRELRSLSDRLERNVEQLGADHE